MRSSEIIDYLLNSTLSFPVQVRVAPVQPVDAVPHPGTSERVPPAILAVRFAPSSRSHAYPCEMSCLIAIPLNLIFFNQSLLPKLLKQLSCCDLDQSLHYSLKLMSFAVLALRGAHRHEFKCLAFRQKRRKPLAKTGKFVDTNPGFEFNKISTLTQTPGCYGGTVAQLVSAAAHETLTHAGVRRTCAEALSLQCRSHISSHKMKRTWWRVLLGWLENEGSMRRWIRGQEERRTKAKLNDGKRGGEVEQTRGVDAVCAVCSLTHAHSQLVNA